MWRVLLAINQGYSGASAQTHQSGQGNFGGIGGVGKHRLAKHRAPDTNAIQTADQMTINPGFYAVRVASGMKSSVGRQHLRDDPSAVLLLAHSIGAGAHDPTKVMIDADFTARIGAKFLQRLAQ